jgi:hypothetical protein
MSEVSTLTNQIDSLIVSLSENEKQSPGKLQQIFMFKIALFLIVMRNAILRKPLVVTLKLVIALALAFF